MCALILTLFFLCGVCSGRIIQPSSSGGSFEGDPAPGRSPGPPEIIPHERETSVVLLHKSERRCSLLGEAIFVEDTDNVFVNVTLSHRLFETNVVVAGMVYQVAVSRLQGTAPIEFTLSTTSSTGAPLGTLSSPKSEFHCDTHEVRNELELSELVFNWTLGHGEDSQGTNVTFELTYRTKGSPSLHKLRLLRPISTECQLWLRHEGASLTSSDFPSRNCQVWFPNHQTEHGLIVELSRLNVPCTRGYLHFSGLNITQRQHFRSHKQAHVCGKLEELSENERHVYFPWSHAPLVLHLQGNPVFALSYRLVDRCYNVTFLAKNGTYELGPSADIECTFRIFLPYGNRVALTLWVLGDISTPEFSNPGWTISDPTSPKCDGLEARLIDGGSIWAHCARPGETRKQIEMVSRENKVVLRVSVRSSSGAALGLRMNYRAEPVEEIAGVCGFGWIGLRQFCVAAVEDAKLPWSQAEIECGRRGGHLASIRSEEAQDVVDKLLRNSPGYRDHNSYWIGASDKVAEGEFRWSDGLPFTYTNWFPGWQAHGHSNRQPNDDGLSEQDCVEVRRIYHLPSSSVALAPSFMWNDRDCATPNYFICERLQNDEPLEDGWLHDCNRSVVLSRQQPRAVVSSPGFPRQYPDNVHCEIEISAPSGYRLVLDFEELVLENEPSCSYDYLDILENSSNSTSNSTQRHRHLCGDWSSKLKMLRYVSRGSRLKMKFVSDYSHHFGGFKARVSMENAVQCADDRLQLYNNSCYLFVSYPEVTWTTARQICQGLSATLASILSPEEEKYITTNIRKGPEYRTGDLYWLGARLDEKENRWTDGNQMNFHGWLPGQKPEKEEEDACLGLQWTSSPTPMLPSGLYWKSKKCSATGGYVCKRPSLIAGTGINFNKTINGTGGNLTTPNYPRKYYNNLDFDVEISGPDRTRLLFVFLKLDLEPQLACLYDYVEIKSVDEFGAEMNHSSKFCGVHDPESRLTFVSKTNKARLIFHSDFSISGKGFFLTWKSVTMPGCPVQTFTAMEGSLVSPNYPDFLLPHLDCSVTILAPAGKRVWLEFKDYDVDTEEAILKVNLGGNSVNFRPYQVQNLLTEGTFISYVEDLQLNLQTFAKPFGRGYKAVYKTSVRQERVVFLQNTSAGILLHLNYPDKPPRNVEYEQHFVAPLGYVIHLELYNVKVTEGDCSTGSLEIYDNYADINGTSWHLCSSADENSLIPVVPTAISSYLNTIHLRQVNADIGIYLNGSLRVVSDPTFTDKLLKHRNETVESCDLHPCLNSGKCVSSGTQKVCQCNGYFTGLFCALTLCDLEPCTFGKCELTGTTYKCHCKTGYTGPNCDRRRRPCESNPCENRGVCVEKAKGFHCRCHAWWEGQRCENRMKHIPYKPLSERMFHEPFWLGLMTVSVVMGVIGLVWCAKRHFPEKIEKLLSEEAERNRSTLSSLRSASVREQLAASGSAGVTVAPSPGSGAPKSLFGRLGIRKPSILSLTSPHASGYVPATARTFSLDDLLKPPLRRTPSPKKKRNNSTPTKKNAAEKKQILQQLISPAGSKQNVRKVNLGELMQLNEQKNGVIQKQDPGGETQETKFTEKIPLHPTQLTLSDPKLEKKVTFARLLNRVSAEMSSGSEMELGIMQANKLSYAFARPSSTPPSPIADARSPNSTSSNQGSDSLTSSEIAIPSAFTSSISDFLNSRRGRLPINRQKPSSADSILAMFRNFSGSSGGVNSLKITPSSTPTASSPQDDLVGDDDSSASSIHTPVSVSSGAPESPLFTRPGTIEVPVLDPLSAHKSSHSGSNFLHPPTILLELPSTINKCLSPIREMPTPLPSPMPSPALTPVMRRSTVSSSVEDIDTSDDRISIELPNISISCSEPDEDMHRTQDIAIDPQAEDGLILEEAAAMQRNSPALYRIKARPSPLGHSPEAAPQIEIHEDRHPPLVIPTLTIQTPSPTHQPACAFFPGSPPPHRKLSHPNCHFPQKQSRKMLKELDKPTSLDLPCAAPRITITSNMSEAESDAESMSPAIKNPGLFPPTATMTYLSPFSMGGRAEHASESNLSSSGYSSMASPGPSRCGSSNPLCPSEMEDPGAGNSHMGLVRRPSPLLKSNVTQSNDNQGGQRRRGRSDSETLSDDPLVESNDEGIGTDHLEEKIDEGEVKSAKELEVFIVSECDTTKSLIDLSLTPPASSKCVTKCDIFDESVSRLMSPSNNCKNSLQLPSIVIQYDASSEKHFSPVSSRSESPLSDKTTGMGRFSPQFYGKNKDILPFTDSDGLYDFPSSDKVNSASSTHLHKRSSSRKREKKYKTSKVLSPTKSHSINLLHLDVPSKDHKPPSRKPSPKRRARPQLISSSSSSDSVTSGRDLRVSSSPETIRWSSPVDWMKEKASKSRQTSDDEGGDDVRTSMLPKTPIIMKQNPKISRLRAIGHQIRFLRRLERSLNKQGFKVPESDGEDSPRATSPLLQTSNEPKIEIRKSSSISKLQTNTASKFPRGRLKRSELIAADEKKYKRVVASGNGFSD